MKKIGIFLPGANGDIMSAMSVLKYKNIAFKDREIVWFCSPPQSEVLNYAPVEIRPWEDFSSILPFRRNDKKDNRNYQEIKKDFQSLKDIEEEYFPAPWLYLPDDKERFGIDYPNISKKIFKINDNLEWHPMLYHTNYEKEMIKDFCEKLPFNKTIMLETECRSSQSSWDDNMTIETINLCRKKLGKCNFIFGSLKDSSKFFDDIGMVSCSAFTLRQAALVNNYVDLFIGISSGLSVAVNCWGNKPTPKIQYTNSFICSTVSISNGITNLIEIHNNLNHKQKYYQKLSEILDSI